MISIGVLEEHFRNKDYISAHLGLRAKAKQPALAKHKTKPH